MNVVRMNMVGRVTQVTKGNINIYGSLNDNESMPIRPAIDVEQCTLFKHGRTPPLSRGNRPKLWEQMNAPFNCYERQHDASPFAIFIDAPFDSVHTMISIGLSWEWREEVDKYEVLGNFQISW